MKLHRNHALKLTLSLAKVDADASISNDIGCVMISLLLYLGTGGLILNMFGLPVLGVVPAVLGLLIIICSFIFCKTVKSQWFGIAMLIICIVILWVIAAEFAQAGLSLTINRISEVMDIQFLRINAQYEVTVPESIYTACGTLFLTPFAVPLALLCVFIVKNSYSLLGTVLLAVIAAIGVLEAVDHAGIWSALLCVGIALLICRAQSTTSGIKDTGGLLFSVVAVLIAACLFGTVVLMLFSGNASAKMERALERNQRNILSVIRNIRYKTGCYTVLPEGDFSAISEPDLTNETVLRLKMSKPDSIYLRGYVGEVYTDLGWKPISKKVMHEYTGLFYQLHKNQFYPQTQLAMLASILDDSLSADDAITLTVQNIAACRDSIYVPYELLEADKTLLPDDRLEESGLFSRGMFGTKDYKLVMLPNQVKRYKQLADMLEAQQANPSDELRKYLAQESKYRNFVYEQYTAISPEDSKLLTSYIGDPGIAGQTHVAYNDAKNNILAVLTRHLTYSYENASFNGDGSFLRYIMRKNQSGSTVNYASVAVMMLRHYGIPARYVEGYLITPDDADEIESNSIFDLSDYKEHAWVEYYHDGIGWIPFEVDPNYIGVMEGINDPPSYSQNEAADSDGGEDQAEDNNDDKSDKDDEDTSKDKGILIRRFLSWLLLLLLVLSLPGAWLFYRFKRIENRKKACEQSDNNAAICSMMEYLIQLFGAIGLADTTNSPVQLSPKVVELWGDSWGENFDAVVVIFLKSAFSHHVSEQSECAIVSEFLKRVISQIEKTQTKKKRFIIRYLKCLY